MLSIVCTALAAVTFIVLNQAFEGPSVARASIAGEPYELTATFDDTEALPTKQPVLVRGVQVGKVTEVDYDHETSKATVTFTVDDELGAVHADAAVTIGERTLLGDPYLNLDPGTEGRPELESGRERRGRCRASTSTRRSTSSTRDGRRHVGSIIDTLDQATRSRARRGPSSTGPSASSRARSRELRDLTDALHGQEDEIAGFVGDTAASSSASSGGREQALRRVVASGRATLDALAANTASLEQGVAELPGVLASGDRGAARGREPLLREARPLVARAARGGARPGAGARRHRPARLRHGRDGQATSPGCPRCASCCASSSSAARRSPGSRPRCATSSRCCATPRRGRTGIVSFFANFAGLTAHGDSRRRLGAVRDHVRARRGRRRADAGRPATRRTTSPSNTGVCHNAYPEPGDALDPEPYEPGSYPRLRAVRPAAAE